MFDREELIGLFKERALKFGDFTLASGKKSTYYMDGKQITLHAKGLRLVSEGLLDLLSDVESDARGQRPRHAEVHRRSARTRYESRCDRRCCHDRR